MLKKKTLKSSHEINYNKNYNNYNLNTTQSLYFLLKLVDLIALAMINALILPLKLPIDQEVSLKYKYNKQALKDYNRLVDYNRYLENQNNLNL